MTTSGARCECCVCICMTVCWERALSHFALLDPISSFEIIIFKPKTKTKQRNANIDDLVFIDAPTHFTKEVYLPSALKKGWREKSAFDRFSVVYGK